MRILLDSGSIQKVGTCFSQTLARFQKLCPNLLPWQDLRRAWSAARTSGHEDIERDVYCLPLTREGLDTFNDEEEDKTLNPKVEAVESEAVKEDEEAVGTGALEVDPKESKAVKEDGERPGSHPISARSEAPRPSQPLPIHRNSPENNIRHFRIRIEPPMHWPHNYDWGPVDATSPNKAAKRLSEPETEYVRYRTYSPTRSPEWSRELSHNFYERYVHRDWDEQRELKLEVHKERIKRQNSEAKKSATPAKPSLVQEEFLKRVDKWLKEVQDIDKEKSFEMDELDGDGRQIKVEERKMGNGEGSSRDQLHE